MKSVAVILPTKNRFHLLQRTLRSLEKQTYRDFVVYVSDDGSTDETRTLDAASFPQLDIRWIQRDQPFAHIPDHFNALYREASEEWIALAHDDEIYAPQWLETLVAQRDRKHFSGQPVVLAFGATLVVNRRFEPARFSLRRDELPQGLYTEQDLKRLLVFDQGSFPANGFMVAKSAVNRVVPMRGEYEQFDFEWLMRIAEQGIVAVTGDVLQTYMIHAQNSVGSRRYLLAYFKQIHPAAMKREWLASLQGITIENKEIRRRELSQKEGRARFRTFLKAVAWTDLPTCRSVLPDLQRDPLVSPGSKFAARLLCIPAVYYSAGWLLKIGVTVAERQLQKYHHDLRPVSFAEIPAAFRDSGLSL